MRREKKLQALVLLGVFILAFFASRENFAQQIRPEAQTKSVQAEKRTEKIFSSPKDIKEKTSVFVFLAWIWVVIGVLLYILRQKIKEADRLYQVKFFSGKKE